MTSPTPETLAEMARVDVQTALDEDRDDGETEQQTATRFLAEGVDGRWTPPSGDVGCEPTPEAQTYWAAVRTRLEEIAGTRQTAPTLPSEPTPGEHYWLTREQMAARWPNLASREPFISSCLWCGVMQARDATKRKPCRGRNHVTLRNNATPPPTDGPGLAQAARELLSEISAMHLAPVHDLNALANSPRVRALGRALAAEEERERIRKETAAMYLDEKNMDLDAIGDALERWAKMETSR